MTSYEYYVIERSLSDTPIDEMNMLGEQGWEMFFFHASPGWYRYFFRRVIHD